MRHSLFLLTSVALLAACTRTPVANPDPNHTHADFAVFVNGEQMNFSGDEFMSGTSDAKDPNHTKHDPYLHLHDGNGNVIHRHKPGLTLEDFFATLQLGIEEKCYVSFEPMADGQICGETPFRLFVNGKEIPFDMNYVFEDTDRILITNAATDTDIAAQTSQLSDEACKYSKTCPWKGEPPTENCVADPTVPCVVN